MLWLMINSWILKIKMKICVGFITIRNAFLRFRFVRFWIRFGALIILWCGLVIINELVIMLCIGWCLNAREWAIWIGIILGCFNQMLFIGWLYLKQMWVNLFFFLKNESNLDKLNHLHYLLINCSVKEILTEDSNYAHQESLTTFV